MPQLANFYEQTKFDCVTKLRAKFKSWGLITIANERGSHLYGDTYICVNHACFIGCSEGPSGKVQSMQASL
jgi:hypothetical protein